MGLLPLFDLCQDLRTLLQPDLFIHLFDVSFLVVDAGIFAPFVWLVYPVCKKVGRTLSYVTEPVKA